MSLSLDDQKKIHATVCRASQKYFDSIDDQQEFASRVSSAALSLSRLDANHERLIWQDINHLTAHENPEPDQALSYSLRILIRATEINRSTHWQNHRLRHFSGALINNVINAINDLNQPNEDRVDSSITESLFSINLLSREIFNPETDVIRTVSSQNLHEHDLPDSEISTDEIELSEKISNTFKGQLENSRVQGNSTSGKKSIRQTLSRLEESGDFSSLYNLDTIDSDSFHESPSFNYSNNYNPFSTSELGRSASGEHSEKEKSIEFTANRSHNLTNSSLGMSRMERGDLSSLYNLNLVGDDVHIYSLIPSDNSSSYQPNSANSPNNATLNTDIGEIGLSPNWQQIFLQGSLTFQNNHTNLTLPTICDYTTADNSLSTRHQYGKLSDAVKRGSEKFLKDSADLDDFVSVVVSAVQILNHLENSGVLNQDQLDQQMADVRLAITRLTEQEDSDQNIELDDSLILLREVAQIACSLFQTLRTTEDHRISTLNQHINDVQKNQSMPAEGEGYVRTMQRRLNSISYLWSEIFSNHLKEYSDLSNTQELSIRPDETAYSEAQSYISAPSNPISPTHNALVNTTNNNTQNLPLSEERFTFQGQQNVPATINNQVDSLIEASAIGPLENPNPVFLNVSPLLYFLTVLFPPIYFLHPKQ